MRKATFRMNRAGSVNRWLALLLLGIAVVIPAYTQTKPATPPPAPQDEPPQAFTVEPGFKYDPKNRLDPFVNPTPPPKPPAPPAPPGTAPTTDGSTTPPPAPEIIVPVSRPRGLKGLMLEDISLKGVVVAKDPAMTMAIIQGPGNKTYNVARKDELFNAVIKDIRLDGVVFTPIVRKDDAGEPLTIKEVRSDTVIYTKPPKTARIELSPRDVVRKLHPAPGEPK